MMLYLASNTIPGISFAVHRCARFTHNTKVSHDTAMKRICWYLQGTKYNVIVFNPSKKLVVDCYANAYFAVLWSGVGSSLLLATILRSTLFNLSDE